MQTLDAFSASPTASKSSFVGFDLGTSGARVSVIQQDGGKSYEEVYAKSVTWGDDNLGEYDEPDAWMKAIYHLFRCAADDQVQLESVKSICFSGTSASCLLVKRQEDEGESDSRTIVRPTRGATARMYNYNVDSKSALEQLNQHAPEKHTARSPTGSLAKLLAWNFEDKVAKGEMLCHQADYVARQFLNDNGDEFTIPSDWHNCLKLGYDVRELKWPSWLLQCLTSNGVDSPESVLPSPIISPGEPMGSIRPSVARKLGLSDDVVIVGGTTDSNAAFFAAVNGAATPGTAVTSLGSTLAIKQLSSNYVEDAEKGVYSHRFPSSLMRDAIGLDEAWLAGGASNVGCVILRELKFSNDELVDLSKQIDPEIDSPLTYYPLANKGERFPVADSEKEPLLDPVPDDRSEFLHGILQGISDVERDGFLAMGDLGAMPSTPKQVWTCGGGSRNDMWSQMRQRRLRQAFKDGEVKVAKAENVEASYGAAILAAASFRG